MKRQLTEEENKTNESNMVTIDAVRDLAKGLESKAHGLARGGASTPPCATTPQLIEAGRLAELSQRALKALAELQKEVFIYRKDA